MRASLAGVLASVCVAALAGAQEGPSAAQMAAPASEGEVGTRAASTKIDPTTASEETVSAKKTVTSEEATQREDAATPDGSAAAKDTTGTAPKARGNDAASGAAASADDAALLEELTKEMKGGSGESQPPAQAPSSPAVGAAAPAARSNPLGLSNLYNPAISFNGLFLGTLTSERSPAEGELRSGLAVQELELQLMSNVDPYFLANVRLSLPEGEGIGLEEGYVIPSYTPFGIQARIGKMRVPFGRENVIHTHALPFIDKSLVGTAVFGEESLGEVGVELSYLFPLPWYALLTAGGYNGDNEVEFRSPVPYDLLGAASLQNLFDLTDDAALEVGLSYAAGNNASRRLAQVVDAYAMLKWRPARPFRDRGLVLVVEAMYATRPNTTFDVDPALTDPSIGGAYAYLQWRLAQRWYTGARFDTLGLPGETIGSSRRGSAILVFAPTEFSAIRLQLEATREPGKPDLVYAGLLQLNFTLGAHPAHSY